MKRAFDSEHLIDGSPMLMPDAGINITYTTLEGESGRDESGVFHRFVIRRDQRKWDFSYAVLTVEEWKYMKSLLSGKSTFLFTFKNEDGEDEQVTAYSTDPALTYYSQRLGLYKNLKFSIIEC